MPELSVSSRLPILLTSDHGFPCLRFAAERRPWWTSAVAPGTSSCTCGFDRWLSPRGSRSLSDGLYPSLTWSRGGCYEFSRLAHRTHLLSRSRYYPLRSDGKDQLLCRYDWRRSSLLSGKVQSFLLIGTRCDLNLEMSSSCLSLSELG